jgi:isocitrate/isopropylmalate dehydrogenase
MKNYRIACIPGDGIGKEVVPAGQAVLQAWPRHKAASRLTSPASAGAATGTAPMAR